MLGSYRIKIQTLDPIELFVAKANALLTRAAARDLYDFYNMISVNLFADNEDVFRHKHLQKCTYEMNTQFAIFS